MLPVISDEDGTLSFIEGNKDIPFKIARVYYLCDIPKDMERGKHAHRALEQILVAPTGQLEIFLDDGKNQEVILLNSPRQGLYIPSLIWRELRHFSKDAVCLVLASAAYDEADYIRSYDSFIKTVTGNTD